MLKRSSKRQRKDINVLAGQIVEETTREKQTEQQEKNPYAVALGRLGGKKGGITRAERLSSEERSAIARKAALTRWHGKV